MTLQNSVLFNDMNATIDKILRWVHRYVSPVFLALLVASFILWYIAKLSYTYTTDQCVRVDVDGERFEVTCVVEGIGTNLFGYRVYSDKLIHIPLADLKYTVSREEGHEGRLILDPQSLQNALSLKFSDIKVKAIRSIPEIDRPETEAQ